MLSWRVCGANATDEQLSPVPYPNG
jgi:hypothetical protein